MVCTSNSRATRKTTMVAKKTLIDIKNFLILELEIDKRLAGSSKLHNNE